MSAGLFSEFSPSDKTSWEKLALIELKGKNGVLSQWQPAPGVVFEPYQTRQDLDYDKVTAIQNAQRCTSGWLNMPAIPFAGSKETNSTIKDSLRNGADAIWLDLTGIIPAEHDFPRLLNDIKLSDHALYIDSQEDSEIIFSEISKQAGYYLKGGIAFDPLAAWMRTGRPFGSHYDRTARLMMHTKEMREFRPVMIESHLYHNNGADPVQELAFTMASVAAHMDMLTDRGVSPFLAFNRTFFSISVGTKYLTEIAKLRALRFLLQRLSRGYDLPDEHCIPFIHARTSAFYQTAEATHTNMVRATSEAMSAVLGGCDALTVLDHERQNNAPDAFAVRVARNVSTILASESLFGQVADPAAGSYLLEDMSIKLAEAAWSLFLEIEEKGGIVRCFEQGMIQSQLHQSLLQKADALHSGAVMVGVNKFRETNQVVQSGTTTGTNTSEFLTDHNLAAFFHTHPSSCHEA